MWSQKGQVTRRRRRFVVALLPLLSVTTSFSNLTPTAPTLFPSISRFSGGKQAVDIKPAEFFWKIKRYFQSWCLECFRSEA
ncbi:hypothetical protein P8452_58121 [Trifolium repens]|nr:hypothetical protein P8452_58121 [Trifolium repens]